MQRVLENLCCTNLILPSSSLMYVTNEIMRKQYLLSYFIFSYPLKTRSILENKVWPMPGKRSVRNKCTSYLFNADMRLREGRRGDGDVRRQGN